MTQIRKIELDILQNTLSGVAQLLPDIFSDYNGKPLSIIIEDPDGSVENELFRLKGDIELPYCVVNLASIRENLDSYNRLAMSKYPIEVLQPNDTIGRFRLRPVIATLSVRYVAGETKTINKIISRWLMRDKELYFGMQIKGLTLKIRAFLGSDVSFPTAIGGDNGGLRKADFSIETYTYIGEMETLPPITKINATLSVSSEIKNANTTTFTIKRKVL